MSTVDTKIVSLTESAAIEVKRILENDNIPQDHFLRIGVKGGGCSGLSYILDFEARGKMDDMYEEKGVQVIVDPRQSIYLMGIEVDFEAGLNDRGFVFINPNAANTCGCGTSFST